jgi:hypothetical protein
MERKLRARLESLPRTEASFIEPMECLSVSRLPEGTQFYCVFHYNAFVPTSLIGFSLSMEDGQA